MALHPRALAGQREHWRERGTKKNEGKDNVFSVGFLFP